MDSVLLLSKNAEALLLPVAVTMLNLVSGIVKSLMQGRYNLVAKILTKCLKNAMQGKLNDDAIQSRLIFKR